MKFLEPGFAKETGIFTEEGKAAQPPREEGRGAHKRLGNTAHGTVPGRGLCGGGLGLECLSELGQGYAEPLEAGAKPLYTFLYHKWYVDEGRLPLTGREG